MPPWRSTPRLSTSPFNPVQTREAHELQSRPRRPFFALFQTYVVCACDRRHVSRGSKMSVRILAGKAAQENIELMRGLLQLEREDDLWFEDERGGSVVPDYDGLEGQAMKVSVYVRRRDGEFIKSLSRHNVERRFDIHEDTATEGRGAGIEGWYEGGKCTCYQCVLGKERDAYEEHLQVLAAQLGSWSSSTARAEESIPQESVAIQELGADSIHDTPPMRGGEIELDETVDRDSTRSNASALDTGSFDEHIVTEYHYGRIIPGPDSYSVEHAWEEKKARTSRIAPCRMMMMTMPTDDDYRSAASILRRMR
ncbi:uncharacterized protein PV09_01317 [Verruconis gallopava]|uniref:Uncharacterized protein n=1 Tax=Verruconis gallopava TaxID=253628 RepID=A0A0D2APC9_9PEZI|nr:uncharacterized protein PV09_01317 [Verruconis gallopava]KIW08410.1 hypothetical protein PV09_01317 [Verruconis gallopava]